MMAPGRRIGAKVVALFLALTVAQVFARADLTASSAQQGEVAQGDQLSGRLLTRRNLPILVDEVNVISGATIFSGARIQTFEGVGATVQLAPLGQLDISPKSNLTLVFSQGSIKITLVSGCIILTTNQGVNGLVTLPLGTTHTTDPSKISSIDICLEKDGIESPVVNKGAAAQAGAGSNPQPVVTNGAGTAGVEGKGGGGMSGGTIGLIVGALGAAIGGAAAAGGGGGGGGGSNPPPNNPSPFAL